MDELQQNLIKKLHKQVELSGKSVIREFDVNPVVEDQSINQETPIEPVMSTSTQSEQINSNIIPDKTNLRERILAVESQLGESHQSVSNTTAYAKAFLDDFGEETYYVENISNGHVVLSDLNIKVERSKCEDLLKFATIEELKKSRDLKDMLTGARIRPMLKRLTPEEYLERKKRELQNKQIIEQMKTSSAQQAIQQQHSQNPTMQQQTQVTAQQSNQIRPTILSKLEKLRLSTIPAQAHLGLTPIEFTEWAVSENLSSEELNFIASHPNVVNNSQIRTAIYKRLSDTGA